MIRGIVVVLAAVALVACSSNRLAPVHDGDAEVRLGAPAFVTVARGDTMESIARRHGVPLAELIAANNVPPPYVLMPGQRLRLPGGTATHTVRPGDTLLALAFSYDVDMARFARINGLAPPYTLKVGRTLILPADSSRDPVAGPRPPAQRERLFGWPVRGDVVAGFGPQGGGIHKEGIDIAVPPGALVVAADNGIVAYAGDGLRNLGSVVVIRHADGWFTAYARAGSILVRRGETVRRGQPVATASVSRDEPLHFQVLRGTEAVDPVKHLGEFVVGALPANALPPG